MPSPRSPAQPESSAPAQVAAGLVVMREVRLPARPAELERAREYADEAGAAFGLDPRRRFEWVFAANEAVTNAIRHGTPDDDGTIGLRIVADANRLTLSVSDRGPFIPAARESGRLADHGRGLASMVRLMDDVELLAGPDGTVVNLHKDRHGAGDERG